MSKKGCSWRMRRIECLKIKANEGSIERHLVILLLSVCSSMGKEAQRIRHIDKRAVRTIGLGSNFQ